jgi:hypothetical protein
MVSTRALIGHLQLEGRNLVQELQIEHPLDQQLLLFNLLDPHTDLLARKADPEIDLTPRMNWERNLSLPFGNIIGNTI